MTAQFIPKRPLPDEKAAGAGNGMGRVTVEDAAFMLVEFENGTAIEPNFYDGMKEMRNLEAGLKSAEDGRKLVLS